MVVDTIERVAVLGAGSMGHGIAEVAALGGYDVTLRDVEADLVRDGYESIEWSLEKLEEKGQIDESARSVLDRIDTATELEAAVHDADLVVEAAPEKMALKREIFADLDELAPADAILATNTSSLSITEISEATDRPGRVVGTHFFNPPVKMDLVEVVYGDHTADGTAETAAAWAESIDKTPIFVRKDVNGFVVNNVLVPFMAEAAWMLSADETEVREADAAMVFRRGYPMGPFELADFTGIDIGYHARKEAGRPIPPVWKEKVESGHLGKKSGRGYYDHEDGEGVDYEHGQGEGFDTLRIEARMVNEAAKLVGAGVAPPEEIDVGMRLGGGFAEGVCRMADKRGLDAIHEKLASLYEETGEARYEPADYLRERVEAGHTGEAAGEGFYDYSHGGPYHYLAHELDDDGVLRVTFEREERLNAFNDDMLAEVDRLLGEVDTEEVSCVVFEGSGGTFSAGADLTAFPTAEPRDMMDVDDVFRTVYEFERPTLAKIDGYCLGAGFELALACDMRVATEDAAFGTPEIDLGVIPGGGATQRLVRLVGEVRTKELVFRGNHVDAETAADWGVINRAVPAGEFDDVVDDYVEDLVSGPPVALKVAKKVINDGQDASLETALNLESQGFGLLVSTDDMLEGVTAFRDDREPEFEGE
ncbi:3-hydroxyacyl-CoA dehydrogenase/enoyl-CoA hydratase family protein [Halorarum halobium]|uniref:3-hydroxyacyl-CoA dehydrogenase/enoyl-CoA hydratase family protein n=1 Tax=Halorarum halobium TaxID=3075121 RepID=UPI0028A7EAB8|nr:3-hydroxyacyl-CoA dehydrogenase NAD-binding domain-containing protein [Halobaculum sp. XH14]